MEISVIIPTFNAEKTIARCIESLLNQTNLPLEIIIADGNSKDNTKEICNSFNSPIIKFIVNRKGHATGSNRNLGAKVAKFDHLIFLDSDVVADRNLIKNYADSFIANDCIAGNVLILNPGNISSKAYFGEKVLLENHLKDGFIDSSFFWVMNFGIKKDKYIDFPDTTYSEDMVFISDLFKTGLKVKFCKTAVVFHSYPETILDFFIKKIKCAKGFIEQKDSIENVHKNSYFGLMLELMTWDINKLKEHIEHKKISFDLLNGFNLCKEQDPNYPLENALCLSAAVAVLEKNGGKLDISYEELLR
jgi:glycosyltransferase involved in cell wall biosynthesis